MKSKASHSFACVAFGLLVILSAGAQAFAGTAQVGADNTRLIFENLGRAENKPAVLAGYGQQSFTAAPLFGLVVSVVPLQSAMCNGRPIRFRYTIANISTVTVTNITVQDSFGNSTVIPSLAHNTNTSVYFSGLVNGATNVTVSASGTAEGGWTAAGSGSATANGVVCGVTVTKSVDHPAICGGQYVTYTITLTNNSSIFSWEGNLYDTMFGWLDPQNFPHPTYFSLDPSETRTYQYTVFVNGTVTNTSTAVGETGNDATPASHSASATVTQVDCSVRVEKLVNGAIPTGADSFTFQLRSGASADGNGTTLETKTANAANSGVVEFETLLVAGATYQMCEANMLPGWLTSLADLPGAFVPNSNNPPVDNSTVCVDFSVALEETKTFEINNELPPGGDARTIGYWKNWSSCSGGNQAPVLDYVLSQFGSAPAGVPVPLPDPLPPILTGVDIGDLRVDTCEEATSLLDKRSLNGRKKASDPAFNMAAQFLAARLNIQAAADPRCIDDDPDAGGPLMSVIDEAQFILDSINFNGNSTSNYSKATGNRMNVLAGYLDRYNNNDPTLCPLP